MLRAVLTQVIGLLLMIRLDRVVLMKGFECFDIGESMLKLINYPLVAQSSPLTASKRVRFVSKSKSCSQRAHLAPKGRSQRAHLAPKGRDSPPKGASRSQRACLAPIE